MWPFKKHYPRSIPMLNIVVGCGTVPVGLNQYFRPSQSKLLFCYAADWFAGAYGGSTSEGRHQVSIYKTKSDTLIRVCQEMSEDVPIIGEIIEDEDVRGIYFEALRLKELGARNIRIIIDNLNYEKEEV